MVELQKIDNDIEQSYWNIVIRIKDNNSYIEQENIRKNTENYRLNKNKYYKINIWSIILTHLQLEHGRD